MPVAGQGLRIKNTDQGHLGFQDVNLNLVDPTTVTLKVKDPTGVTTTYTYPATIVKDSVGVYHVDIDTTGKAGTWLAAWIGTFAGSVPAYVDFQFSVDAAAL